MKKKIKHINKLYKKQLIYTKRDLMYICPECDGRAYDLKCSCEGDPGCYTCHGNEYIDKTFGCSECGHTYHEDDKNVMVEKEWLDLNN